MKGKCSLKMKKIALVKWILDESGGGERVAVSLANELTKKYEFIWLELQQNNQTCFLKSILK